MSIRSKRLKTNWALLGILSLAFFVLLGFVDFGSSDSSYWGQWKTFLSGDYSIETADFLGHLLANAVAYAVPCVALGFFLQVLLAAGLAAVRGGRG